MGGRVGDDAVAVLEVRGEHAVVSGEMGAGTRDEGGGDASHIGVMTMHQLKGREYDSVLLVEDEHQTFRRRDNQPPHMETRRLLQVSLTRARHFACILSGNQNATLDVILAD